MAGNGPETVVTGTGPDYPGNWDAPPPLTPQQQDGLAKWNVFEEVRNQYPGLRSWTDEKILDNLSDPKKFRDAFPQFAHLSDDTIIKNMAQYEPKDATQRFAESAVAPFVGTAKGLYHAATDAPETPLEKGLAYTGLLPIERTLIEPSIDQLHEAYEKAQQGKYSEAIGHSIAAAVPVVGPWAAQVGETEGKQLGAGDYAGAAGTAVGNTALALAPKAIEAGAKAVPGAVRAAAGAGPGTVRSLVQKFKDDNAAAIKKAADDRGKTLAENRSADEKTLMERGKVDEHNAALPAMEAAAKEAEKVNAQVARRTEAQKEFDDVTSQIDVLTEKARHDSLDEGNKKYSAVNSALDPLEADSLTIAEDLDDAREKLRGKEVEVAKTGEEKGQLVGNTSLIKKIADRIDKSEIHPVTYKDLQGYFSELGNEMVKGTLPGDVYKAYDILHNAIGKEMQRIANSKGMGKQLLEARAYWKRMKQTFGKSSEIVRDRAAKAVKSLNPKLLKGQKEEYRLRLLSSFNPEIGKLAQKAEDLRKELATLPKTGMTVSPAVRMEYSEPKPTKAVEKAKLKKIGPEEIQAAKREGVQKRQGQIDHRVAWAGVSAAFYLMENAMRGRVPSVTGTVVSIAAPLAIQAVVTKVLSNPKVVEWLTKARPEDVAMIPPDLRGSFPQILTEAQKRGIRISPALAVLGKRFKDFMSDETGAVGPGAHDLIQSRKEGSNAAAITPRIISEKEAQDIRYDAYAGSFGKRKPPETRDQYIKGLGITGEHVIVPVPVSELNTWANNELPFDPAAKEQRYAKLNTQAPPIHLSVTPNGKLHVRDGAHRVAAAKIRGDKTINAMMKSSEYKQYSSLKSGLSPEHIVNAVSKLDTRGRGNYIAIEDLRKANPGITDEDILKAVTSGKLVLSRYDGIRVPGMDLRKYLKDPLNPNVYYIGVAIPRK